MTREDFRIRKVPTGYKVWQRIGSGWEALSQVYGSRADAREAVDWFANAKSAPVVPKQR